MARIPPAECDFLTYPYRCTTPPCITQLMWKSISAVIMGCKGGRKCKSPTSWVEIHPSVAMLWWNPTSVSLSFFYLLNSRYLKYCVLIDVVSLGTASVISRLHSTLVLWGMLVLSKPPESLPSNKLLSWVHPIHGGIFLHSWSVLEIPAKRTNIHRFPYVLPFRSSFWCLPLLTGGHWDIWPQGWTPRIKSNIATSNLPFPGAHWRIVY